MRDQQRDDFKEKLAKTLESIFDELKKDSKTLANVCVLPTHSLDITISPVGAMDEIPLIKVTYEFLPNKESLDILWNRED